MSVDTYTGYTVNSKIWFEAQPGTGYIIDYTADVSPEKYDIDISQGMLPGYLWERHGETIEILCREHAGRVLENWTSIYTTHDGERVCVHCGKRDNDHTLTWHSWRDDDEGEAFCGDCLKLLEANGFLNEEG